jgi:hypothetical protein
MLLVLKVAKSLAVGEPDGAANGGNV